MLGAIMLGTLPFLLTADRDADTEEDNRLQREALASVLPPERVVEDVEGFALHILCDREASETFAAESSTTTTLSANAAKRNEHLSVETGAALLVTVTDDFVKTAKEDILSGENRYNLYAADAAGSLSVLLSAGYLADVSDSAYIRGEKAWFDGDIMDELSIYGGKYLISSSAADARSNAAVIVYNRSLAETVDLPFADGQTLASLALAGDFTVETLLAASRAAYVVPTEEQRLLAEAYGDGAFYGFSYDSADIFPLYFGAGGNFVTTDADTLSIVSLSALRECLAAVKTLTEDETTVENAYAFSEGAALFSVHKLSEIHSIRETITNIGILPLPKKTAEEDYHSYIDLAHTTMLAIPKNAAEPVKIEYLVSRMAFLSYGYIEPVLRQQVTAGNAEDEKILSLLADTAACDLSALFGYGDIDGLLADTLREGDDRLAINYYNRKTLYEKALSIIEKRLSAE
ncbi:MAG: hypothetical protein IJB19_02510 [Clostridia bacterium]|nr:hypothetical protein [Clostridia bacterium]